MEFVEILIGGVEVIAKIFAEWVALCQEGPANHPFLRPEWFTAFIKNFSPTVMLFTFRTGGKLRAVLPLMKQREKLQDIPIRKLQAVFNLNTQRFDLIHGADESERKLIAAALWKGIRNQPGWQVVEMRLVDRDSWINDLLAEAERDHYHPGIWEMDSSPFIELPLDDDKEKVAEDYFKGLSKHFKQDLDRRLRRLKEQGQVDFCVTTDYVPALLQQFFDLEKQGWKGRERTSAGNDQRVSGLHDDFANAAGSGGSLFIYELKLDDKPIAMQLRLMFEKQTVCWKTAYDEDYARVSPGNLLFRQFTTEAINRGSSEIDLLSPPSQNKNMWATGKRKNAGFYIFRPGLVGWFCWRWKFTFISRIRQIRSSYRRSADS
ncbi:MAG: GNAT family N-acetyltransferase [Pyrinomonadaceae bacterium]